MLYRMLLLLRGHAFDRGVHGGGRRGLAPLRQAAVRAADARVARAARRRRPRQVRLLLLLRMKARLLLLLLLRWVVRGGRRVQVHRRGRQGAAPLLPLPEPLPLPLPLPLTAEVARRGRGRGPLGGRRTRGQVLLLVQRRECVRLRVVTHPPAATTAAASSPAATTAAAAAAAAAAASVAPLGRRGPARVPV